MYKRYAVKTENGIELKLLEKKPDNSIAAYFQLFDDGATFTCKECGEKDNGNNLVMAYIPEGGGVCCHKKCLEETGWLSFAVFGGDIQL